MIYAATGRFSDWYWLGYGHAQNGGNKPQGMTKQQERAYEDGYSDGKEDKNS